jgi:4-hydroxy-3-methylbut-2-en-1-yl diphosphate reductase
VSTAAASDAILLDGVVTLGLTAGASTPESFVRDVIGHMKLRGFGQLEEHAMVREDIHFALPCDMKPAGPNPDRAEADRKVRRDSPA